MTNKKEKFVKVHELKILPDYFHEIVFGFKTAEIRFNDRDYKVGDHLILINTLFPRKRVEVEVTYILTSNEFKGLSEDYVCLSFKLVRVFLSPNLKEDEES